jgi:hypothetical protein
MTLSVVLEADFTLVEGRAGQRFMEKADDASRVVEACLSRRHRLGTPRHGEPARRVLRLSSRVAGEVLQKLRNYRVRLAVVCTPGTVRFSSRFGEMLAEERRLPHFGVFDTRDEAIAWLCRPR